MAWTGDLSQTLVSLYVHMMYVANCLLLAKWDSTVYIHDVCCKLFAARKVKFHCICTCVCCKLFAARKVRFHCIYTWCMLQIVSCSQSEIPLYMYMCMLQMSAGHKVRFDCMYVGMYDPARFVQSSMNTEKHYYNLPTANKCTFMLYISTFSNLRVVEHHRNHGLENAMHTNGLTRVKVRSPLIWDGCKLGNLLCQKMYIWVFQVLTFSRSHDWHCTK